MARIPEFQRQRLASQLVGTPSVDNSGQQIAQSISQVAFEGSQVLRQRQVVRDQTEVTRNVLEMNAKVDTADREFKNEVRDDPRGKDALYFDRLNEVMSQDIESIENKNIASQVNASKDNILLKRGLEFNAWSSDREVDLAFSNSAESNIILVSNVMESEDISGLSDNLLAQQKINDDLKKIIDPKQARKIDAKQRESLISAYMYSQLDKNPENLLAELNSKEANALFLKGMTPEKNRKFKKDAELKIDKKLEEQDRARLRTALLTHDDLFNKISNGENVIAEIELKRNEGTLDDRSADLLMKTSLERVPNNIKDSEELELWERFSSISASVKNEKITQSFDQILNFKNDVLDKFNKGLISVSTAKTMNNTLGDALISSVKKKNGAETFGENVYEIATETVRDYAKSNNRLDDPKFMTDVLNTFVQRVGNQNFKEARSSEERAEIRENLQLSIADVLAKENPLLNLTSKDTERLLTRDGSQKNINQNPSKKPKNDLNLTSFERLKAKDGSLWLRDIATGRRRRATDQEIKELF